MEGLTMDARGFCIEPWWYEEDHDSERYGLRYTQKLERVESDYQIIEVYEAPRGRFLTIDGLMMLTSWDEFIYHEMLAHVPMCSVPHPQRVLIIGGGDCGCLREVLRHPSVEDVVQCEIDPRVTEVCRRWFPWVEKAIGDPRALLVNGDGADHVQNCDPFDVIIIDSTDPVGEGLKLFTREFYENVGKALAPGGIMAAQTESPQNHPEEFSRIYRELRGAFPGARPYLGNVPCYPGGMWSWAVSRESNVIEKIRGRYYSSKVHEAAFVLPPFVQELL